jgi:plasmid replication initiation protein
MKSVVEKSFYLTSLFADIKSEHTWTSNEIKTVMLMFSKMNKYKIYIPNFSSKEEIYTKLKKVPQKYIITKSEFLDITNTRNDNFSREVNKVRKKLIYKVIHTPHPFEEDPNSGESITWFTKITYSNIKGELELELSKYALERLVAFVKYSKITFENLVKLKNNYSIYTYLFLKIIKDISFNESINNETLNIDDFKEKLSLKNKYKDINLFRERVLDVIEQEINRYTDLTLNYSLIKEGRSFTKIKFNFDYKLEYLEQKSKSKSNKVKQLDVIESKYIDNYDSPFEHILIGWNIRAKKVVEIEENYSLEVIQQAIDLTLEKEKAGDINTTKAAIFLGILENKQLVSDEQFERSKIELEQQQYKQLREQVSDEYDKLSSFILSNQDIIQSALTANTKHLPITDKDAIPVFKKIKSIDADKFRAYTVPILSFYHFESNSNVSSFLSDVVDRSHYIEIEEYKDDIAIVQAYKEAIDKIKEDQYITQEQQAVLKQEVQEIINLLLGF